MKQGKAERIEMKPERLSGLNIWEIIAGAFAFGGLFLAFVSATEGGLADYLAVLPGLALIAVRLTFGKRKLVRLLVPAFCAVWSLIFFLVNINGFAGSAVAFINRAVAVSNTNMHYGIPSLRAELPQTVATDFFFASTLSVWFAFIWGIISERVALFPYVAVGLLAFIAIFGLFPSPYTVIILLAGIFGKYIAGYGADVKTAVSLYVSLALVFAISAGGFFYQGSSFVQGVKTSFGTASEQMLYGSDSLPQGRLKNAAGMNDEGERLEVTLYGLTPTFYLKGFVGAELNGNEWKPTDKNAYVSAKYQGIIDYLAQEGIPDTQYAEYLALGGRDERHEVTIENKNANAKYAYMPYSLAEYSGGFSSYYDMGLRRDVFSASKYTVQVVCADVSSEGVVQANWLTGSQSQTADMKSYLSYEGNYRNFVYENYCGVSEEVRSTLRSRLGDAGEQPTVNSVTRLIRTWLETNYRYTTSPDAFEGDFMNAFLGEDILMANPAYFASVAVYAFRAYGFAARYAEGYLVQSVGGEEQVTVSVTGANAHAWAEVYFDGIGWLPVEVTPTIYALLDPDRPPPKPPEGAGGDDDPDNKDPVDNPDDKNDPDNPDNNEDPNEDNKKPLSEPPADIKKTVPVLRVLVPVLACVLAVALAALFVFVRREYKLQRKRKRLRARGELYGRTAYDILCEECKPIGGYDSEALEKCGVPLADTERFIQIVERAVHGGYELSDNERRAVESYLIKVSEVITASGGKAFRLRCKYFYCLGL
ncbi:MAG: transglutaminase-like domain-containing protein [Clostridia bacterium]|nr:transglutaminase-like domain-containing protein [Clostridia bacterium]